MRCCGGRLPATRRSTDHLLPGTAVFLTFSPRSAIWNVTYLECRTTFAPILINFSLSVVNYQCFTDFGSANRRRKFPRLYARAKS